MLFNTSSYIQVDGVVSANGQAPCLVRRDDVTSDPLPQGCSACPVGPAESVYDFPCAGGAGAAGGTIVFIARGSPTALNGSGSINASGAPADSVCQTDWYINNGVATGAGGGAGGRIQLPPYDDVFDGDALLAVWANGGAPYQGAFQSDVCTLGAAGTVFYTDTSTGGGGSSGGGVNGGHGDNLLLVQQDPKFQTLQSARSYVCNSNEPLRDIGSLQIINGAMLDTTIGGAAFHVERRVSLSANAFLTCSSIVAGDFSVTGSSSIVGLRQREAQVKLNISSLYVDPQSDISNLAELVVSGEVRLSGVITTRQTMHVSIGEALTVKTLGSLHAGKLSIVAGSMNVYGQVQASDIVPFSITPYGLNCSDTAVSPFAWGATLWLNISSLTIYPAGVVASSVIAACTDSVEIEGLLTATSLGQTAGNGLGKGEVCTSSYDGDPNGAGSGAGHGGMGGSSGGRINATRCAGGERFGATETYDATPQQMTVGSGGGGENGGSGGGIVALQATASVKMMGSGGINSDGGDANDLGVVGVLDAVTGCGGGAGGSIYISAASLQEGTGDQAWSGVGYIQANGGAATGEGGGGGGGYIRMQPLPGQHDWQTAPSAGWALRTQANGGPAYRAPPPPSPLDSSTAFVSPHVAFAYGEDGLQGNVSTSRCGPGRFGTACQNCPAGYFKPDEGSHACTPCPTGESQTESGQAQCKPCAPGKKQPLTGQTVCIPCPSGHYSLNRTYCAECEPGSFSGSQGSAKCLSCDAGFAATTVGLTACKSCTTGYYANASMCAECGDKPRGAHFTPTCNTSQGSLYDCACGTFVCNVSSFVSGGARWHICGPALDVLLLRPSGEMGRVLILVLPVCVCALLMLELCRRIGGTYNFREGMERAIAKLENDFVVRARKPIARRRTQSQRSRKLRGVRGTWRKAEPLLREHNSSGFDDDEPITIEMHGGAHNLVSEMPMPAPPRGAPGLGSPVISVKGMELPPFSRGASGVGEVGEASEPRSLLVGGAPHQESLEHVHMWQSLHQLSSLHVRRLHLVGSNTATRAWRLPALTASARRLLHEEEYKVFAAEIDRAVEWMTWEVAVDALLSVLCPPGAITFRTWRRRAHFVSAQLIVSSMSEERAERLWNSLYTAVGEDYRMEIRCCDAALLAWIDVFAVIETSPGLALSPQSLDAARHATRGVDPTADLPADSAEDARKNADAAEELMHRGLSEMPDTNPNTYTDLTALIKGGGATAGPSTPGPRRVKGEKARLLMAIRSQNPLALGRTSERSMRQASVDVRVCVPLRGQCSYISPCWLDVTDFYLYAALSEALGEASTIAVGACLNVLLLRIDRSSPDWRAALKDVLLLIQDINEHLRAAGEDRALRTQTANEGEDTSGPSPPPVATGGESSVAVGGNAEGEELNGKGIDDGNTAPSAADGGAEEHADETTGAASSRLLLLGLVISYTSSSSQPFALVVGYGEPTEWKLVQGQRLLEAARVEELDLGSAFVDSRKDKDKPPGTQAWLHSVARRLAALGRAPVHPYAHYVAPLLLVLQLLDLLQAVLLLGTLCSASAGTVGCAATILLFPFAGVIAPILGITVTLHVLALDWHRGITPDHLVEPQALSRSAPTALVRRLRIVSVWQAASLFNAFIGLISALFITDLFTTQAAWLLPVCMLLTKLLLLQVLTLLGTGLGLARGAFMLLVGLVGGRLVHSSEFTMPPPVEPSGEFIMPPLVEPRADAPKEPKAVIEMSPMPSALPSVRAGPGTAVAGVI